MKTRNPHLAKQLRAALRRSRWDAGTLARRAYVARADMARALTGDTSLSLHVFERVAEQLEVNLEFVPWMAAGQPPALGRAVETVVDQARGRLKARSPTNLAGILKPPPGVGSVSIDDMRL